MSGREGVLPCYYQEGVKAEGPCSVLKPQCWGPLISASRGRLPLWPPYAMSQVAVEKAPALSSSCLHAHQRGKREYLVVTAHRSCSPEASPTPWGGRPQLFLHHLLGSGIGAFVQVLKMTVNFLTWCLMVRKGIGSHSFPMVLS